MRTELQINELARLSNWAARELKTAHRSFEVGFEKKGMDHLEKAMGYVRQIDKILHIDKDKKGVGEVQ